MKKMLRFMLVCLLLLVVGCGGNNDAPPESPETPPESTPGGDTGGIYREAGKELGDFYDAFNGGMGVFERAVNTFETDDWDLSNVRGDFIAPTGAIVTLSQYDYLQSGDNAREEGKNGDFDAVREKNGDVITFSQSMTREEDGFEPNAKKGDVVSESGTLNTATDTMTMEAKTERGGTVVSRTVSEVVRLPDGTFIAQIIDKPQAPADTRVEDRGVARFVRFTATELEIITAYFPPEVNFTYNTIVGKSDAAPESMAEGYTKARQLLVKDGVASATKY